MIRITAGVGAVVAASLTATVLVPTIAGSARGAAAESPACSLVSMPDGWNADIGDLRQLATWRAGLGNSTSPQMRKSVATVLDAAAAEQPEAVLVAGDLVEGHWGADVDGTRLFGKVRTLEQRQAALRRAGAFYYGEWAERFALRGLTVYPAIGDHEVGDDPWRGSNAAYGAGNDFKRRMFPVFKQTWANVFTRTATGHRYSERPVGTPHEATAYAVEPCPGVLVVTVDVFRRGGGDVHAQLGADQMAWLDRVLSESTAETKIVQGHTPVLGPVNREYSSGLMYDGGKQSAFWQTLAEHDVDLYLCGEVHTVTVLHGRKHRVDVPTVALGAGVTQISHGGLIHRGRVNYLTIDLGGGGIDMEVHRFTATVDDSRGAPTLWATTDKRPFSDVVYRAGTTVTGTMTIGPLDAAVGTGELALTAEQSRIRR